MKKKIVSMVLVMAMLCGLCSTAYAADEYDLRGYTLISEEVDPKMKDWIAAAEEATGLKINLIGFPSSSDSITQVASTVLSTGDKSIDVLPLANEWSSMWKNTGWLEGLNDTVMTEDVVKNFHTQYIEEMTTTDEGQIIGVPFYTQYFSMWINQEILEECGYDSVETMTLDEFKEFLAAASEKEGRYGWGGAWEKTFAFNDLWMWVYMFGGDPLDWTNEGNREALEFIKEMVDNGWVSLDAMADQHDQEWQKFVDGDYAGINCFRSNTDYESAGKIGENLIHMTLLPAWAEKNIMMETWDFAINSASEHKEAAIKFLQWLTTPEAEETLYSCIHRYPARTDVAASLIDMEPYEKRIYDTIANEYTVHARPLVLQAMEFVTDIGTIFQEFVQGQITVDEFCEQAQTAVETYS